MDKKTNKFLEAFDNGEKISPSMLRDIVYQVMGEDEGIRLELTNYQPEKDKDGKQFVTCEFLSEGRKFSVDWLEGIEDYDDSEFPNQPKEILTE